MKLQALRWNRAAAPALNVLQGPKIRPEVSPVGFDGQRQKTAFANQVVEKLFNRCIELIFHSICLTRARGNVRFLQILFRRGKMPQHKSAKKRLKTAGKNQARNRAARSTLKSAMSTIRELPTSEAREAVNEMQSVLDRAVKRGLMHRNKAARLKSGFKPGS